MDRLEKILSIALANLEGDNYLLAIIVAKRSEQLSNGAEPLIPEIIKQKGLVKPADIALYELAENRLNYRIE